jgi:hypothetical protein
MSVDPQGGVKARSYADERTVSPRLNVFGRTREELQPRIEAAHGFHLAHSRSLRPYVGIQIIRVAHERVVHIASKVLAGIEKWILHRLRALVLAV